MEIDYIVNKDKIPAGRVDDVKLRRPFAPNPLEFQGFLSRLNSLFGYSVIQPHFPCIRLVVL